MAPLLVPALVAVVLFIQTAHPAAHDIPASVLVQAFAKPEGTRLTVLLRVPLVSMRDFNFPAHPGLLDSPMLDVGKAAPMLKTAAELWLVPAMPMFEDGARTCAGRRGRDADFSAVRPSRSTASSRRWRISAIRRSRIRPISRLRLRSSI